MGRCRPSGAYPQSKLQSARCLPGAKLQRRSVWLCGGLVNCCMSRRIAPIWPAQRPARGRGVLRPRSLGAPPPPQPPTPRPRASSSAVHTDAVDAGVARAWRRQPARHDSRRLRRRVEVAALDGQPHGPLPERTNPRCRDERLVAKHATLATFDGAIPNRNDPRGLEGKGMREERCGGPRHVFRLAPQAIL